jgi:hypothetical protein
MAGAMATYNPTPATPAPTTSNSDDFLASIIPGYKGLVGGATGIIGNLLNGSPSPSTVRNDNATFGVSSGQPATSGLGSLIGNRGYDLYKQQGQANQQTGMSNLLNLISGISSPILANQGQQMQNTQATNSLAQNQNQFTASQAQNQNQFGQNLDLQNFLAQLQALQVGKSIVGNGTSNANFNL